jgi:hypothetical protein
MTSRIEHLDNCGQGWAIFRQFTAGSADCGANRPYSKAYPAVERVVCPNAQMFANKSRKFHNHNGYRQSVRNWTPRVEIACEQ